MTARDWTTYDRQQGEKRLPRPWPNKLGWDYKGAEVRILSRPDGSTFWRVFVPIGDTGTHRRLDVTADEITVPAAVWLTGRRGEIRDDCP